MWQHDDRRNDHDDEDRGTEGRRLLISRNFPCEAADDRVQFQLKIHLRPNDNDTTAPTFMAVYLVYCGKDEEVRANFEIAIVDCEGEKKNARYTGTEWDAWRFRANQMQSLIRRLISRAIFLDAP